MKKALFKVPNGKLLKIFLEDSSREHGRIIENIKITGDFFTYPEENIEKLEQALIGKPLYLEMLKNEIDNFLKETKTEFFGIDSLSIAQTILQAQ